MRLNWYQIAFWLLVVGTSFYLGWCSKPERAPSPGEIVYRDRDIEKKDTTGSAVPAVVERFHPLDPAKLDTASVAVPQEITSRDTTGRLWIAPGYRIFKPEHIGLQRGRFTVPFFNPDLQAWEKLHFDVKEPVWRFSASTSLEIKQSLVVPGVPEGELDLLGEVGYRRLTVGIGPYVGNRVYPEEEGVKLLVDYGVKLRMTLRF